MRIAVIGSGYVGLVTGACFAECGFKVVNIDQDEAKIANLKSGLVPFYEPGLESLVAVGSAAGRLAFTCDLPAGIAEADIVFIAVGTPSLENDGHADLSHVFEAARAAAMHMKPQSILVVKSTVPVGTCRQIAKMGIRVASNPEFLREGSALEDFHRPDRIIIGTDRGSETSRLLMHRLYEKFGHIPTVWTEWETSELIKYASNAFLATKIAYINQMADLCERVGANIGELAIGMGLDRRIGDKFLQPGPGYGGSCFPKDTLALSHIAQDAGAPVTIVDAVIAANQFRFSHMAQKIIDIFKARGGADGKTLAVLGVTFKANTDDMRHAPSLSILPALEQAGLTLHVYDPSMQTPPAGEQASSVQAAVTNADGLLILTEWDEFKTLDINRVVQGLKFDPAFKPLIIDLRNLFEPTQMGAFEYHSLGRGV
ncbi:MAG: UDP-glucose/GDP-mannose dehydrogenase family protein [Myxococcota bacterium]